LKLPPPIAEAALPARSNLDKLGPECALQTLYSRACSMGHTTQEKFFIMTEAEVDERIRVLIEPFNKKGVEVSNETTFANDLEFDSLTVMDFVAEIEDEFDIIISMNQQAEIENYGQLIAAVHKLQDK
jgi:acyl carrier protein